MQKRRRSSTNADLTAFLSIASNAERFVLKSCKEDCSWLWASCLPTKYKKYHLSWDLYTRWFNKSKSKQVKSSKDQHQHNKPLLAFFCSRTVSDEAFLTVW